MHITHTHTANSKAKKWNQIQTSAYKYRTTASAMVIAVWYIIEVVLQCSALLFL